MQNFKNLEVWQLAHKLRVSVYDLVVGFPREELYGLRSQATRAAGSVAANIAEGCGRNGDKEFARFLDMAMGSATELECHLLCARDRGFVGIDALAPFLVDLDRLQKMLAALIRTVRARIRGSALPRNHQQPRAKSS
jgi:four helix bundle protein